MIRGKGEPAKTVQSAEARKRAGKAITAERTSLERKKLERQLNGDEPINARTIPTPEKTITPNQLRDELVGKKFPAKRVPVKSITIDRTEHPVSSVFLIKTGGHTRLVYMLNKPTLHGRFNLLSHDPETGWVNRKRTVDAVVEGKQRNLTLRIDNLWEEKGPSAGSRGGYTVGDGT